MKTIAFLGLLLIAGCAGTFLDEPSPDASGIASTSSGSAAVADAGAEHLCAASMTARGPLIRRVVLRGTDEAEACTGLTTAAGKPADDAAMQLDVATLQAKGYVGVVSSREPSEAGLTIVFSVKDRPRVAHVDFVGTKSPKAGEAVKGVVGTMRRLDPSAITKVEAALVKALAAAGFRHAKVKHSTKEVGDSRVDLRFEIDEGTRSVVGDVRIDGVKSVKADAVRAAVTLAKGDVVTSDRIDAETLALMDALADRGLLEARVKVDVTESGESLTVVFAVEEGPVFKFSKAAVVGDAKLADEKYAAALAEIKPNSIFSRSLVNAVRDQIQTVHDGETIRRRVEPDLSVDAKTATVAVAFTLLPE